MSKAFNIKNIVFALLITFSIPLFAATDPVEPSGECNGLLPKSDVPDKIYNLKAKYKNTLVRQRATNTSSGAFIALKIVLKNLERQLVEHGVNTASLVSEVGLEIGEVERVFTYPALWQQFSLDKDVSNEIGIARASVVGDDGDLWLTETEHVSAVKWNFASQEMKAFLGLPIGPVLNLKFSFDNKWVYAVGEKLYKFDRQNLEEPVAVSTGPAENQGRLIEYSTLVLSPDEQLISTYSADEGVWNIHTSDLRHIYLEENNLLADAQVSFSNDSKYALQSVVLEQFTVVKIDGHRVTKVLDSVPLPFYYATFSPTHNRVVYLNSERQLTELDIVTKTESQLNQSWQGAENFRLSKDGRYAILFRENSDSDLTKRNFVVVDLSSGKEVSIMTPVGWTHANLVGESLEHNLFAFANVAPNQRARALQAEENFVIFDLNAMRTYAREIEIDWSTIAGPAHELPTGVFNSAGTKLFFYDANLGLLTIEKNAD